MQRKVSCRNRQGTFYIYLKGGQYIKYEISSRYIVLRKINYQKTICTFYQKKNMIGVSKQITLN